MDPADINPDPRRRDQRSPLLRAQSRAASGEKVNVCPFGCENEDLDEHGYCFHLVGFTVPNADAAKLIKKGRQAELRYEPFLPPVEDGIEIGLRKVVGKKVVEKLRNGRTVKVRVSAIEPVEKQDKLVEISHSWRVYRDVGKPDWWAGEEEAEEVVEEVLGVEPETEKRPRKAAKV